MFEKFEPTPQDPIIRLLELFRGDARADKIDMGVGVFRDSSGGTPIMRAVREAEAKLHHTQTTKAYVGLAGDEVFNAEMAKLVFTSVDEECAVDMRRVRALQAPGGCGALRILSDMLFRIAAAGKIWVSDPTWGNHYPIFRGSGFAVEAYPYLNRASKQVDVDAMMGKLSTLGKNDIVVFHACCHNPSGAELQPNHWDDIAALAAKNGFFPFFDMAYQGFGDSLSTDAYSIRAMAGAVESMVVASSCSKNFGLYRDRVGCALILGESSKTADLARAHFMSSARSSYSMPPDHGAALVAMILTDETLKASWQNELGQMRQRMLGLRLKISEVLREKSGSDRWDFIAAHRGMFSLLVLDDEAVNRLRDDFGVYVVAGGRINIAGLKDEEELTRFADALVAVT